MLIKGALINMNVAGRLAFAAQGAFFLEVMELKDVIVVFPVKETALSLRALIEKNGFHVSCVCALGTSALDAAQHTTQGVMVCPFLMRDMSAAELAEQLPKGFDVIALSKNGVEQYMGNLITLPLPMDRMEFINTVAMLVNSKSSFTRRAEADGDYISKAKQALMSIKGMSEMQAHKFLQKESMRSGKKISAVAMDILDGLA